jgi:hypothetical protein
MSKEQAVTVKTVYVQLSDGERVAFDVTGYFAISGSYTSPGDAEIKIEFQTPANAATFSATWLYVRYGIKEKMK